ncbi:hypothetical protein DW894_14000 [Ruminococcus sp. AM41-10BH]|nr:hypothetical protein DW894_14000 [Ruminococcus sp. AM41-10BH]
MEYLVENIRRIKEIEPNWLDIVKKELDNDVEPENKELARQYNKLWESLRTALKRNQTETEKIFEDQIGNEGNWILKDVEDSLEIYFSFKQLRMIQEKDPSKAEEILKYLFENVIIYYTPKFPRKYRDFGFETVSEFLDMTIGLNGLVDFYIRRRYTIDAIKEDLKDETGLKEELCDLMAGIIKENYQSLQMGLIMSYMRKTFDRKEDDSDGDEKK